MTKLKKIVESVMSEYFDDDIQKSTHDFIDHKNPYSSTLQDLVSSKNFKKNHLATSNPNDARALFAKHILPVLDRFPDVDKLFSFKDNSPTSVTTEIHLHAPNKQIDFNIFLIFGIANGRVKVTPAVHTYYPKNKINPEQEKVLSTNSDIISTNEIGDYIRFNYKPFANLKGMNFDGPLEDQKKLLHYLQFIINTISKIIEKIMKSDLP